MTQVSTPPQSSTPKPDGGRILVLDPLMSTMIDLCCTNVYSPLRLQVGINCSGRNSRHQVEFPKTNRSLYLSLNGGAPKVHEELHGQRKWMKEWRKVGRHLQAMEGERGDRIS